VINERFVAVSTVRGSRIHGCFSNRDVINLSFTESCLSACQCVCVCVCVHVKSQSLHVGTCNPAYIHPDNSSKHLPAIKFLQKIPQIKNPDIPPDNSSDIVPRIISKKFKLSITAVCCFTNKKTKLALEMGRSSANNVII